MKHLFVEGLPHHVPIRKENRWEAIQHYATAPYTAVAAVPTRRPDISELLMPERQESVSSHVSQYSAQNRQSISCNSPLTTTPSREDDGDNFSPLQPRIPLSGILRTSILKSQESISCLLSSPGSQNSTYTSKHRLSSNSLFSRNSLNTSTTIEEKEEEDANAYRGYAMHLTNKMKSPPVAQCPQAKSASKLDDWFQYFDNLSASQEENPIVSYSGRTNTIPVITECYDEAAGTNSASDYCTSETEGGTISEMTESSPGTGRNNKRPIHTNAAATAPPTADTIRQVLHDYAPHSGKSSSDETTTSAETGSTKLDQLREKMKKLRERRALSISQTSQSSNKIPENIEARFQNPSLHRTKSSNAIIKKKKQNIKKQSVSFSESTHSSKPIPRMIEQDTQNESNASSSSMESHSSYGSTAKTNKIRGNSHCNRKARPSQPPKALTPVKRVSKGLKKNIKKEVPLTLFSIDQVAEEAVESLKVEMKHDAQIQITTSTSSSSEEAAESLEITNSSSFASSKCASIAEEAVESLRAERLQLTSSSSFSSSSKCTPIAKEVPVVRQRKYDPHIHITRQYSMKELTEELSPKSKRAGRRLGSSRLASKLERGSNRESSRSLTSKLEAKSISEPMNLVDELKEALTERGPPVPAEEELQHPWSDPFPSDGIEPLASRDSLSTQSSPGSSPKSFRERYLKNIGDSEQSRTPRPFSTKNLVLGSLPQNMPAPDVYCPFQDEEETREAKDSFSRENETKTSRSKSPKKWMTRKSVRKNMKKDVENAGKLSPGRTRKSWMPRKNMPKEKEEKQSRQATPLHESGQNNPNKPSWAQRSFVNRFPSSFKEKNVTKKSSFRRPSSGSLAGSTSNSSKGKERERSSTKSPSRHLVRSKSSKEKEMEREHLLRSIRNSSRDKSLSREPSSGSLVRRASNSSRDKSIKSLSKKTSSKRLLRNLSNSSRDKSIKSLSREPSSRSLFSNSSRDKSIKSLTKEASSRRLPRNTSNSSEGPSSRSPARRSSKSSVNKESEGSSRKPSFRKPVRSASKYFVDKEKEGGSRKPFSGRLIGKRDKSIKSYTNIDTASTKKPSSGRFGSTSRKSSNDKDNPKKPSSGRFGAASRKSDKDKNSSKKPYSRRFSAKRSSSKEKECITSTKQQQRPSRRHVEVIDKRDDSYNSVGSSKKSSSRRAGLKSSRDHSHKSYTTSKSYTTVGSDQSGSINNDSSSIHHIDSPSKYGRRTRPRDHSHKSYTTFGSDQSGSSNTDSSSSIQHIDSPSKHGRRTRARTPTSQRKTRYKDYRKNGVLSAEQKRFHVDMCGGIE